MILQVFNINKNYYVFLTIICIIKATTIDDTDIV